MKPRNRAEEFLLKDYGYGRLNEAVDYIREHKSGLILSEINNFFDRTILGTWKGRYPPKKHGRYSRFTPRHKTHPFPMISKIWTTEEAFKSLRTLEQRGYSLDFPYHLSNWDFWHGLQRNEVEEYMEELKITKFPMSRLTLNKGERQSEKWKFQLLSENEKFAFYVTGSSSGNTKTIIVDFDTGGDFVEEINGLVSDYYRLLNLLNLKIQGSES